MHFLYFVKVSAENSRGAKNTARAELDNNNFAGECGFFG